MLLHVSEEKDFTIIKTEVAECPECGCKVNIGLIKEVRVVKAMIILKQTEIKYRLACSKCKTMFTIGRAEAETATLSIPDMMRLTSGKEFPVMIRILFFLWVMAIILPIANLIIAWKLNAYRPYFGDASKLGFKVLFGISLLYNIWMIIAITYMLMIK
jgi:hypothetical protein